MNQNELTQIRRDLHQIPEIGLLEHKTSAYIEKKLRSFGITEIEHVLETGLIARIKGKTNEKSIAFRADIDALPIEECVLSHKFSYLSHHKGFMHACGHDGHTTILLGFAHYLSQLSELPPFDIILIFQPAEEGPGGAELILKTGVLAKYNIKKIIGCHIFPDLPQGKVSSRAGGLMARNGEVKIEITGNSAHGAQPQLGSDAILASSAVISAIHTILSRNISPLDSGVLTFGKISGGDACNIIPKSVIIEGTMRAFDDDVYEKMVKRLEEVVESVAKGYGCSGRVTFNHMYRVVKNDPALVSLLEDVCGEKYVTSNPYMLSEDFSFFQEAYDGLFFFLGSNNQEKGFTAPLHNNQFDFDESILQLAIQIYVDMMEKLFESL